MSYLIIVIVIIVIIAALYINKQYKYNKRRRYIAEQLPDNGFARVISKNLYLMPDLYQKFAVAGIQELLIDVNYHKPLTIHDINNIPMANFMFYIKNNEPVAMLRYYYISDDPVTRNNLEKFDVSDFAIYITSLYVHPDFRKMGIASNLVSRVIKCQNYYYLSVLKNNTAAINLYEKLGFTKCGETYKSQAWLMVYVPMITKKLNPAN